MNRDPAVDQWLDAADGPPAEMMRRARDIILGADGRVTESIKWKTPTFAYQLYRLSFKPSVGLTALTIFDAAIAWLTYREYRKQLAIARQ